MDTQSSQVRDEVARARAELGATVEELAYRVNAPARIRDRVTQSVHDIRRRAPERRALAVRGACVLAVAAGAAVGLRWLRGRR